ncbi:MAG TPA: SHOCT domain-containing protein [Planctomycetota bacterium]|nr:SHOCT domain-containing protein [Planctomycetota bacterium]
MSAVGKKLLLVAVLCVPFPGCLGLQFGGGSTIQNAVTPPTLGKEFEDLDDAFHRKAISQEEYDEAKHKLLTEGRKF